MKLSLSLINKGFKQNEGQFFTPIPITRFIWDSLPVERTIKKADGIEFSKITEQPLQESYHFDRRALRYVHP